MIRINLLPPEIGRKRRDEERWRWVILGGILGAVVLVGVFAFMALTVSVKQGEVAAVQQEAAGLQQSAERFKVFQQNQAELEKRKGIARTALAGRIDWSKLYSEIALVLPADIYLIRIGSTEPKPAPVGGTGAAAGPTAGKLTFDGRALDFPNDVPDLGYKSLAKLLVRLADLDLIGNVWLTQSVKPALPVAATTESGQVLAPVVDPYITFAMSADISAPPTVTPSATGVPAPPTP